MHVAFIPYGKRELVERLIRDMEAQKHFLRMTKDDKEQGVWIDGQIRVCPFGVYEYVFPKEDKDAVLNTLSFNSKNPYNLGLQITFLRKALGLKKAPKFSNETKYLWRQEWVSIIPIGVRYDGEIVGSGEIDNGWTHEAI